MAKGKGFDPIGDANELANNNINPYHWVNRVTSYTYARWMANKKLAIINLPFYALAWIAMISIMVQRAKYSAYGWKVFFDFGNVSSLAFLVQLLFFTFYTTVTIIMVVQNFLNPPKKPEAPPKEKPKKQPKRRKDYGRK